MTQAQFYDWDEEQRGAASQEPFQGNTSDLVSFAGLITGLLLLFTCLTCGWGSYCLPFLPLLLGIMGLATARTAVNPSRTKLWSWIGLGSGALIILLSLLSIAASVAFVWLLAMSSEGM